MPANNPMPSGTLLLSQSMFSTSIAQGLSGGLPIPSDNLVGRYAQCSDLFGEKTDLVLCSAYTRSGNIKFFWQPVRPDWKISLSIASMTLSALKTPNKLRFTGTLAINQVLTLDPLLAYPGHYYDIRGDFTGIGTVSFTGLEIIGSISSLLAGGSKRISYDGSGYSAE